MQRALAHHQLIVDGKWIHISVSNLFRLVSEPAVLLINMQVGDSYFSNCIETIL